MLILGNISSGIDFPLVCGLGDQMLNVNFIQVCDLKNLTCLRICLTFIKMSLSVNFTKVCGPIDLT